MYSVGRRRGRSRKQRPARGTTQVQVASAMEHKVTERPFVERVQANQL